MNKLDRQISIAMLLQNRKSITAQQIAEYLEISVRTVYRDIQVLSEMGLPVVSLPGEGYAIMEGYKLPPLTFNRRELAALHVVTELGVKYSDRELREAIRRARLKIESVIPPKERLVLDEITENILVQTTPPPGPHVENSWVAKAERAISEKRLVRLEWLEADGKRSSLEAAPLLLYYVDGSWLLIVWDRAGEAYREFNLESLEKLVARERTFTPPEGFTFSRYWSSRQSASAS